MKKFLFLPLFACAALSTSVLAESPDWNYLQASYAEMNVDNAPEVNFNGYAVGGSGLIGDTFFIIGKYSAVNDSGYDQKYNQLNIGLGARYGLNETTDFYGIFALENTNFDLGLDNGTEDGYSAKIGIRSMITDDLDVNAAIGTVNSTGSETLFEVDAFYSITEEFSVGFEYGTVGDFTTYAATVRYEF